MFGTRIVVAHHLAPWEIFLNFLSPRLEISHGGRIPFKKHNDTKIDIICNCGNFQITPLSKF
jgi:hypothetical protein